MMSSNYLERWAPERTCSFPFRTVQSPTCLRQKDRISVLTCCPLARLIVHLLLYIFSYCQFFKIFKFFGGRKEFLPPIFFPKELLFSIYFAVKQVFIVCNHSFLIDNLLFESSQFIFQHCDFAFSPSFVKRVLSNLLI